MLSWLLGFLFGRQAQIFDENGRVRHDLGQQKWQHWNERLKANPHYNWRDHKGKNLEHRQPKA